MVGGTDNLNTFDAACVALAMLAEQHTATEHTYNPKGLDSLLNELGMADSPAEGMDEMEQFRAASRQRSPKPSDLAPVISEDPMGDMAAMRATMGAQTPGGDAE